MLAVRGVSLGVRASEIVVRDRPRAGGVPPRSPLTVQRAPAGRCADQARARRPL